MSKEEIKIGIMNTLTRGESLENAKNSFINAGYNQSEVEQAVKEISLSTGMQYPQTLPSFQTQQQTKTITTQETNYMLEQPAQPGQQTSQYQVQEKKGISFKIILLFIILFILIGSLVASILYGKEILDFMFK